MPGPGRSPPHRGGRVASWRSLRPLGRRSHPPAGVHRLDRPAPCRGGAGGAARTHRHPTTVTRPIGGSGSARISRSNVDRLTFMPNAAVSRAPARPTRGQRDRHQRTLQTGAAARMPLGQTHNLLDERTCAAVDVVAEEPAHRQPEHDRAPRNGKIRHPPPIAAVHPGQYPTAPAATRPRARGHAATTTASPTQSMPPIATGDSCGSRTREPILESHRPRAPRPRASGQPGPASRNVCQNHSMRNTTSEGAVRPPKVS